MCLKTSSALTTGDTFSLTCSFQNLQNVNQLKITRGENKDVVMVLQRGGTVDQPLNHIVHSPTSAAWRDNYGSATITANITCGDENLYICEAYSNSGKAVVLITVLCKYYTLYIRDHVISICLLIM